MHLLQTYKTSNLSANVLNKTKENEKNQKNIWYILNALFHSY